MDSFVPVTGLEELDRHLDDLLALTAAMADGATSAVPAATRPRLDARLFDSVELQLTDANIPALAPRLLPKIVAVLQQQPRWPAADPAAAMRSGSGSGDGDGDGAAADILSSMATKLLGPVRFADVFALASEADLVAALSTDAAPATNVLAMTVVHKAVEGGGGGEDDDETAHNLGRLADMSALLTAFLTCWLAAPAVEVGEKGGRVLGDLLDVDCPLAPPPPPRSASPVLVNGTGTGTGTGTRCITVEEPMGGGGPGGLLPSLRRAPGPGCLWRRLLRDGLLHNLLVDVCSAAGSRGRAHVPLDRDDSHRARLQRSIAQGRVLRVLPRLASLNLAALATASPLSSPLPSPSPPAPSPSPSPPLSADSVLVLVALHMVDRSDRLMHLSLIDFFESLVCVMRVAVLSTSPPANAAYAVEVLRRLLRDATVAANDDLLADALRSLPDRTVPDEADALRLWLRQLMPPAAPRVAGWQQQ